MPTYLAWGRAGSIEREDRWQKSAEEDRAENEKAESRWQGNVVRSKSVD